MIHICRAKITAWANVTMTKRSSSGLSECTFYKLKTYLFIHENQFLDEKWTFLGYFFAVLFFKLLPKVSDFINSVSKK